MLLGGNDVNRLIFYIPIDKMHMISFVYQFSMTYYNFSITYLTRCELQLLETVINLWPILYLATLDEQDRILAE